MTTPDYGYRKTRDEIELDKLETQIEEIDDQIAELERARKKLIVQQQFVLEDYTRRGRDV